MAIMSVSSGARSRNEPASGPANAGFTLVELLIAMFLMTIIALALAQMVGVSVATNRASTDYVEATYAATDKMEELRDIDYVTLAAGGSLDADIGGFSDILDIDGDGNNDYTRRWLVTDLGDSKRISVRVIAQLAVFGPAKDVTLVALLAAS